MTTASGPMPQYPIESVDNALKVVLLLAERGELRLTDVSDYLGVASSSAHRMLAMLLYRGFVQQDPKTKIYTAGTALTKIAFSITRRLDFLAPLRPYLEKLSSTLDETVHLSMLDNTAVCFVDAIEGSKVARTASRVGMALPASTTASGKAMLAGLSLVEIEKLYPTEELVTLTDRSIKTKAGLLRELAQIRRRGYACSSEESEADVSSIAVAFPARDGLPHLAFSTAIPRPRMSPTGKRRIGEIVMGVVDDAAQLLKT
ncbi:IclR family transcriptional regulator [Mycolicibacterium gadium]|uniref:IclR family transcriptional regulator n=1 Tax=Mycolicibacterium gadium TaxID=1794 RepID=UPI001F1FE2F5|nr:IclR family transcriptional regulator [Mycolicibacterium gadium]